MSAADTSTRTGVGGVVAGRYQLRDTLGEHPAFVAYRAFDAEIDVEVALWHMRPALFADDSSADRFLGAAVEMRAVRHANLLRMFDAGSADGAPFVTLQMYHADGLPVAAGAPTPDLILAKHIAAIGEGLAALHRNGQVHGRLTPADVVHVARLVKLGGAGLYGDIDGAAAARCWAGQTHYWAPEIQGAGMASPASDVYSLAVIAAELAVGRVGADPAHTLDALAASRPALCEVLRPALAVSADARPERVQAFAAQFAEALGAGGRAAQPDSGRAISVADGAPRAIDEDDEVPTSHFVRPSLDDLEDDGDTALSPPGASPNLLGSPGADSPAPASDDPALAATLRSVTPPARSIPASIPAIIDDEAEPTEAVEMPVMPDLLDEATESVPMASLQEEPTEIASRPDLDVEITAKGPAPIPASMASDAADEDDPEFDAKATLMHPPAPTQPSRRQPPAAGQSQLARPGERAIEPTLDQTLDTVDLPVDEPVKSSEASPVVAGEVVVAQHKRGSGPNDMNSLASTRPVRSSGRVIHDRRPPRSGPAGSPAPRSEPLADPASGPMARPSRPHLVADAPIQLVSMKPPTEPGVQRAPRVPAIARPEMRPKIRALTDSDLAPDGNLGRYAPPRAGAHQPVRSSVTIWIYLGIIALIAVVAAAVGIALTQ